MVESIGFLDKCDASSTQRDTSSMNEP